LEDLNAKKDVLEDGNGILEKQIQAIGEILENVRRNGGSIIFAIHNNSSKIEINLMILLLK
jgi:hypothetical protein